MQDAIRTFERPALQPTARRLEVIAMSPRCEVLLHLTKEQQDGKTLFWHARYTRVIPCLLHDLWCRRLKRSV